MLNGKFSKIFITITCLISLFMPAVVQGAGLAGTSNEISEPQVELVNVSPESMELLVRFPSNPIFENNDGVIFNESLYEHPSEEGMPDLPVLRKWIELPFADGYSLEIINTRSRMAQLGENGLPVSIPGRAPEEEKSRPSRSDAPAENPPSGFVLPFPSVPVQLGQTFVVRGHNILQVQAWPVMLQAAQGTLEIFEEIHIKINIQGSDLNLTLDRSESFGSPAFDRLLSHQILNYQDSAGIASDRANGSEPILIIAPGAFISALEPLVNLKESQGHPVNLVPLSVTGTTPESIKTYISYAYHNWPSPPTFVILVGDVNNGYLSMPAFTGLASETVTDLYYGAVDGEDWIPDIFVGRLPARGTTQLNIMIDNLIAYNNLLGTEGWVKKAAFLASNDTNYWDLAEATQNYVIQTHTQPAGYVGTFPTSPQAGGDKLYGHTFNAGNTDVINAVNNRRALVSYTGHGSTVSWGTPGYSQSNIRSISHTGVFSVVTSFACVTGDFSTTESFGETWLLQPNKGAVAFIGSSSSSYWGPDDTLERAMMDSLYSGRDHANIVGSFRFDGLMAVEASRPGTGTAQSLYYWESYNLLGDPSLEMLIGPKDTDFNLSVNPSSVAICQGTDQAAEVMIGQINGFSTPVTLSLGSLPSGLSGSYAQNPVIPSGTSTLTLTANNNALVGSYAVKVNGDSDGVHHDFDLGLQVFGSNPQPVNLVGPAHLSSSVSLTPTFTWQETQSSQTYQIQIAKASDFSQLILSQSGLQQPFLTLSSPLEHNTTYYWRVRAANACGNSLFSSVYKFTTMAEPGACPAGMALSSLYQTNFESYPPNWTHSGTLDSWTRSTSRAYSPNYAFFSKNQNETSLQHLTTPVINLPDTSGAPITLAFWHWFEIESSSTGCFDGALLEISTNSGTSWTPINDALLLSSNYSGTISTSYGNPMGGKQAWCGSRDWSETLVNLTAFAGQSIQLRFTQASDASIGLEGWYVDDFSVSACEVIPDYRPRFDTPNVSVIKAPGQETTVKLELTNAGLKPDTYTLNLNSDAWGARVKTQETIFLAAGATKIIEVSVTIPATALPGEMEEVLVSVTSNNDPEQPAAADTATIQLKASLVSFIPFHSNP